MSKSVLKAFGRKITDCEEKEPSESPGGLWNLGGVAVVPSRGHSENSALEMNPAGVKSKRGTCHSFN